MDDHRDSLADCAQGLNVQHDLKDLALPIADFTHDVVIAKDPAAVLTALDFDFVAEIEQHQPDNNLAFVDLA